MEWVQKSWGFVCPKYGSRFTQVLTVFFECVSGKNSSRKCNKVSVFSTEMSGGSVSAGWHVETRSQLRVWMGKDSQIQSIIYVPNAIRYEYKRRITQSEKLPFLRTCICFCVKHCIVFIARNLVHSTGKSCLWFKSMHAHFNGLPYSGEMWGIKSLTLL